jgi:hypothetical protein
VGNEWLNPSHHFFLICGVFTAIGVFWTLSNPSNPFAFLITLICWSLLKLDNLPQVPNHIILALCVNLMWISVLSYQLFTKRFDGERAYNTVRPFLMISVAIVYFFSVFHKLNLDYFNPLVSCAVELYTDITGIYTFFPNNGVTDSMVIYLTIAIEAAIPVLLFSRKFWKYGLLLAVLFHTLLSLHSNVFIMSFSAEIFALVSVFIPNDALRDLVSLIKRIAARFMVQEVIVKLLAAVSLITVIIVLAYFTMSSPGLEGLLKSMFRTIWLLGCLILIIIAFSFMRSSINRESISVNLRQAAYWIFPIILFINGLTPYLGLKTATNFSMFLNLWVKGKQNNNLVLRMNFPLTDYSSDLIQVLASNHPYFNALHDSGEEITHFELYRWIAEHPEVDSLRISFRHGGVSEEIIDIKHLEIPYDWFEQKLLIFRKLPAERPCPCQW